jgi:hypothetical protein
MRTLTNGTRAGSPTPNTHSTRSRAGTAPALLAAVLALCLCMLATPELHAATIGPRAAAHDNAARVVAVASLRTMRPVAGSFAAARRKVDCSAYFSAMFGAMDELDQALATYGASGGSPLLDMAAEVYVIWATAGVADAESQLESCLSG